MSQDESSIPRFSIPDFAARLKQKYPEYQDLDDNDLTRKVLLKHPEYTANVDTSPWGTDVSSALSDVANAAQKVQDTANSYRSANTGIPIPKAPKVQQPARRLATTPTAPPAVIAGPDVVPQQTEQPPVPLTPQLNAGTETSGTLDPGFRARQATPVASDTVLNAARSVMLQRMAQAKQQAQQREMQRRVQAAAAIKARSDAASKQLAGMQMDTPSTPAAAPQQPFIDKRIPNMAQFVTEAANSPAAQIRAGIREQVAREQPTPLHTAWNEGEAPDQSAINDETERRWQAYLLSNTPEMESIRKEYGRMTPAARALTVPLIQEGANILKRAGGVANLGGLLPEGIIPPVDQFSKWANARAAIAETGTQLAPLNEAGQEMQRSIGEKGLTALTELGLTVGDIWLMKKATGMPLGRLMALDTALKTSDLPVGERAPKIIENYALGNVLDQKIGRIASAAIFGAPTAVQTGSQYAKGQISGTNALLQTGIQAGAGFILGGKGAKSIPKETADYVVQSPLTPEPIRDVVARAAEYGTGLVKSEDGRNLSLYKDPQTGATVATEISVEQAKKYDPAAITGEKRPVRNTKTVSAEQYDDLLKALGMPVKGETKGIEAPTATTPEAIQPEPPTVPNAPAEVEKPNVSLVTSEKPEPKATVPTPQGQTLPKAATKPAEVLPIPEAVPDAASRTVTVGGAEFREMLTAANGDMGQASDELAARVKQRLEQGGRVRLYSEGKPVEIVKVNRGMMQDAKGQRWGTMDLATDNTGKNRIEFAPASEGQNEVNQDLATRNMGADNVAQGEVSRSEPSPAKTANLATEVESQPAAEAKPPVSPTSTVEKPKWARFTIHGSWDGEHRAKMQAAIDAAPNPNLPEGWKHLVKENTVSFDGKGNPQLDWLAIHPDGRYAISVTANTKDGKVGEPWAEILTQQTHAGETSWEMPRKESSRMVGTPEKVAAEIQRRVDYWKKQDNDAAARRGEAPLHPVAEKPPIIAEPKTGNEPEVSKPANKISTETTNEKHAAKIAELAPRLRELSKSKNLDDLQSILDDALAHRKEHGGNEQINRLITSLRAESYRIRQPEIKEQPQVKPEPVKPAPVAPKAAGEGRGMLTRQEYVNQVMENLPKGNDAIIAQKNAIGGHQYAVKNLAKKGRYSEMVASGELTAEKATAILESLGKTVPDFVKRELAQIKGEAFKMVSGRGSKTPGRPKSNPTVNSVETEIRARGGVKTDADGSNAGEIKKLKESGKQGLVDEKNGLTAENMAMSLAQDGYGKDVWWEGSQVQGAGTFSGVNGNDFLQAAIDDASGSTKHYSTENEHALENPDDRAYENLVADPYAQDLMAVIESGDARASDIAAFAKLARKPRALRRRNQCGRRSTFSNGSRRTCRQCGGRRRLLARRRRNPPRP
jgi:hypothetical protein